MFLYVSHLRSMLPGRLVRYSDPDLPQLLPLPARPSSSYEPRPKAPDEHIGFENTLENHENQAKTLLKRLRKAMKQH